MKFLFDKLTMEFVDSFTVSLHIPYRQANCQSCVLFNECQWQSGGNSQRLHEPRINSRLPIIYWTLFLDKKIIQIMPPLTSQSQCMFYTLLSVTPNLVGLCSSLWILRSPSRRYFGTRVCLPQWAVTSCIEADSVTDMPSRPGSISKSCCVNPVTSHGQQKPWTKFVF